MRDERFPVRVFHFPSGPTQRVLKLLPAVRRIRGVVPWRPLLFVRALLGARLSPTGEVAARTLVHVLIASNFELRGSWEVLLNDAGGCLCLLREPTEAEFRSVWKRALERPYSFRWEMTRINYGVDGYATKSFRLWQYSAEARLEAAHAKAQAEADAEGAAS